jgi:hypothetical protein
MEKNKTVGKEMRKRFLSVQSLKGSLTHTERGGGGGISHGAGFNFDTRGVGVSFDDNNSQILPFPSTFFLA